MPAPNADGLDPEIRTFQRRLAAGYAKHAPLDRVPLDEARRIASAVRAPFAEGGPVMARASDQVIDAAGSTVRLRIHLPHDRTEPMPALVYLHGGGWRFFSIETHDRLMREYAGRAGVAVIGVDYALAPEARYPQALRQVVDVLGWLHRQGRDAGVDSTRVALGGDSAGANLALAAAMLMLGDGGAPPLRALVLNYGTYCREASSESHRLYGGPEYSLTSSEMIGFWQEYLGDSAARVDPLAEPLHAPALLLRGLPPTFLAVAQCDVLRDDSFAMAARLNEGGVDVTSALYEGTTHSFLEAMSIAAVSQRALAEASAWLRARLDGLGSEPHELR